MKLFVWLFCLSAVVACPPAFADQKVSTQITMVFTGHNAEQFGIHTVAPTVNPAKCPLPDSGYATDSNQPGYRTYYAAVLLAFAERADVEVVVDDEGCVADRPRLIGLNILR
jgi:hypothetical protein